MRSMDLKNGIHLCSLEIIGSTYYDLGTYAEFLHNISCSYVCKVLLLTGEFYVPTSNFFMILFQFLKIIYEHTVQS